MTLDRRTFLAAGTAAAFLGQPLLAAYNPRPQGWRRFELTVHVDLPRGGKPAQLWVPVPAHADADWSVPGDATWTTTADSAELVTDVNTGARFVHARWSAGDTPATLDLFTDVRTQSRAVDLTAPGTATLSAEERAAHTASTRLIPTDGIVRDTAEIITAGMSGDLEKARAIYDWVVDSTERNPETRGCGLGDVATMLHSGDLTGKCADLNALFVGLARAAGLPARDLYGLRVAPSAFGYKSLGAGSEVVTKAQHCRAEVFVDGFGWVPADPADVRKVVLEEPPKTLTLADPAVQDVRAALFGAAEGNWIALNTAHDVTLPGAEDGPVPFLMYPQAEIGGVRQDELAPDSFAYTITAREIAG
ncbi:transglutaminase [Primorskyibacter flagellatus]|uniref:Transglutaminase n=1 Tax=Primorskyibacter flagellatus TaxID=1387277 RepID=A0A917EFV0_9RHOB|nr:transglutaminase domain-containing protein [Primorskyibacter flagellatus]GGE37768.1 transglutaminase [Primorskyibacter flagellatus]